MARLLRLLERGDEIGEGAVVDAASTLSGRNGETDRQVRLADARWAEEDHVLFALDEAERVQAVDLLPFDRRLKREIKLGERLHNGQPRGTHRRLQPAIVAQGDLCA